MLLINAVQMAALWVLYRPVRDQRWGPVWFWSDWLPPPRWDLALLALAVIYALLLFADVLLQLRVLANARLPSTPAGPSASSASPVAPSNEALTLAAAAADAAARAAAASVAALTALISKPKP